MNIYKREPPKLEKRALTNVKTVSGEELLGRSVTKSDESQSRDVNNANIAAIIEIRRMENGFTEKLENLSQPTSGSHEPPCPT